MKRLIIHGNPGIRKDGVIRLGGEEWQLFSVTKNGEWYGPEEVQLWCVVGAPDEREAFERREFIPHFLEVERVDAAEVEVVKPAGDMAV
ncbi:MAG: HAH_0734 family protein [Halobacteriales archaeon]